MARTGDFGTSDRAVDIPGGSKAVLCSCYDGFGIAAPDEKRRPRRVANGGRIFHEEDDLFADLLMRGIAEWKELVEEVDAALVAIHIFSKDADGPKGHLQQKTSVMWQKHGIASASAKLRGGLVVGAAHFEGVLPRTPETQTLASQSVPKSHLTSGSLRTTHYMAPMDSLYLGDRALLRWFSTT